MISNFYSLKFIVRKLYLIPDNLCVLPSQDGKVLL